MRPFVFRMSPLSIRRVSPESRSRPTLVFRFDMSFRPSLRTSLLLAGVSALLCACSSTYYTGDTVSGPSPAEKRDRTENSRDPLLDAPNRSLMSCTSETAVTVLQRVNEVPFACPDLGVSATLSELRDAGWRIIRVDIGDDVESDGHVGFPVTIQVRKLF